LAKDPEKISYDCLNKLFGTEDWFESFYKTRTLDDIFGQSIDIITKACDFDRIGDFYKNRLRTMFSGVAEKTKIFYNSRRSALFQLFFAVGNSKGAPIAIRISEHLMKDI
jgi:hypothetical protein